MKYLLIQCNPYKGGELETPHIFNSVIECLNEVYDNFGSNFNEFVENKLQLVTEDRSKYAHEDYHCFQIYQIENDQILGELTENDLISNIKNLTFDEYQKIMARYE